MVQVTHVRLDQDRQDQVLSGRIDDAVVEFRFPKNAVVEPRGEPFLALALFKAMARGQDLIVDPQGPLDPAVAEAAPKIQSLLLQWNPDLRRITVHGRLQSAGRLNPGVVSSFSAGVDSACTLFEHLSDITHLLTLNSFDAGDRNDDFEPLKAKVGRIAASLGKTFLPVETNARAFCIREGITWNYAHGPLLCLLCVALGFDTFYIPSSQSFDNLKPWGTHPLLDPLWSTATTQIVHDGGHHHRDEKIALLTQAPLLMRELQVCWDHQTQNCGACLKCLRTRIVIEALQIEGAPFECSSLSALVTGLKIDSPRACRLAVDMLQFLRRAAQPKHVPLLQRRVTAYRLKRQATLLAKHFAAPQLLARLRRLRQRADDTKIVRILDPDEVY